jgi:hypothetical protein
MKAYEIIILPNDVSIMDGRLVIDTHLMGVPVFRMIDFAGNVELSKEKKSRERRNVIPGSSAHSEVFKLCIANGGKVRRDQIHKFFNQNDWATKPINSGISRLVAAKLAKVVGGKGGDVHLLPGIKEKDFQSHMEALKDQERKKKAARGMSRA